MLASDILKLDPLPTGYEELVELMREPLWREDDPARFASITMEARLRMAEDLELEAARLHSGPR